MPVLVLFFDHLIVYLSLDLRWSKVRATLLRISCGLTAMSEAGGVSGLSH